MKKIAAIIMMAGWMGVKAQDASLILYLRVINSFPEYKDSTYKCIWKKYDSDWQFKFMVNNPGYMFVDSSTVCTPPDTVDYNDPQWRFKEWHLGEGWGPTIEQAHSIAADSARSKASEGNMMAEFFSSTITGGFQQVEYQVSKAYIYIVSGGFRVKIWMRQKPKEN